MKKMDNHADIDIMGGEVLTLPLQATQDIRRHFRRVYVATMHNAPKRVVGYYSLSTLSIGLNELSDEHADITSLFS